MMPKGANASREKPSNLTEYIRHDLLNRIGSGELGSADLSLHALAAHYKVSLTPLRKAVGMLVSDDFITKLPNRRLLVNQRKAATAKRLSAPPSAPPTARDWDEAIIKEVVNASLGIRSAYLREDALSSELGVGRSIIRQSLSRFAGAGLIEHIPRRGWLAHPLGVEDMRAYLVVREMLEIRALKLARPNLDMAELEKIHARGSRGGDSGLDNDIHEYLIAQSGNRYIRQFFQQYIARYYTELFYFAAPETSEVKEMSRQHLGIIEALLARRWAHAEKLLSDHIKGQAFVLLKLLEKEGVVTASRPTRKARG